MNGLDAIDVLLFFFLRLFLIWIIFKVFIEFVTIVLLFYVFFCLFVSVFYALALHVGS